MKIGVAFPASVNESRECDIRDTIEWYRILGFDRILFVDNGGMDAIVEEPGLTVIRDYSIFDQKRLMVRVLDHLRDCDWVLDIDSDEWLWPRGGDRNIRNFLSRVPQDAGAVALNWIMWGNKNEKRQEPLPLSLLDRPSINHHENKHLKCFVRPRGVAGWPTTHVPSFLPGHPSIVLDERLQPVELETPWMSRKVRVDHWCLAHWYARSGEESRRKEQWRTMDGLKCANCQISQRFMSFCREHDESFKNLWLEMRKNRTMPKYVGKIPDGIFI